MPTTRHENRRTSELLAAIGEDAAVALAEEFAGTRLYVPNQMNDRHRIVELLGRAAADKLSDHYGRVAMRVPLLRANRALRYRKQGLSNGRIAVRLGMTESGVNRLFKAACKGAE